MRKIILITFFMLINVISVYAEIDPTIFGQSAKYQAMGLSGSAFKNDINNLFINPASADNPKGIQFLSMYSTEMDYYNRAVFALTIPLKSFTLGAGYNSIDTGTIIYPKSFESSTGKPIFTENTYKNEVYQMSISKDFNNYKKTGTPLTLGLSYKFFNQGISTQKQLSAQGQGIDFGINYELRPNINIAASIKNLWSSIEWGNGTKEEADRYNIIGISSDWLNTKLNLSSSIRINNTNKEQYFSLGAEYLLLDILAVRGGIKESPIVTDEGKSSKSTSISTGAGLRFSDFNIDYAYVPYYDLQEDTKHIISISFSPFINKKELFSIKLPKEKIIYTPDLILKGKANENIIDIKINNDNVTNHNKKFYKEVPLKYGENIIEVRAKGNRFFKYHKTINIFKFKKFYDIPQSYKGKQRLELMYTYDIVQSNNHKYYPTHNIPRSEFVATVMKIKGKVIKSLFKEKGKKDIFYKTITDMLDFDSTDWSAKYLSEAKRLNIILGYPDGTLRQKKPITRAEALTIIARIENVLSDEAKNRANYLNKKNIKWIKKEHWSYIYGNALYKSGYLEYMEKNIVFFYNMVFSEQEQIDFLEYINAQNFFSHISQKDVSQYIKTPTGKNLFFEYLKDINFIKKPITKIELAEMLSNTSLFQEFIKNLNLEKELY